MLNFLKKFVFLVCTVIFGYLADHFSDAFKVAFKASNWSDFSLYLLLTGIFCSIAIFFLTRIFGTTFLSFFGFDKKNTVSSLGQDLDEVNLSNEVDKLL